MKDRIYRQGLPVYRSLAHRKTMLDDDRALSDYNITEGSHLVVGFR